MLGNNRDWNRDGKHDLRDDYIFHTIITNSNPDQKTNTSGTNNGGGDGCAYGCGCFGGLLIAAIVAGIISLFT